MERWRSVVGYEGFHEVSSLGRVRRMTPSPEREPRVLALIRGHNGYLRANLCCRGTQRLFLVHRLVLLAFVGPCPDGHECRHLDGDPTNNALENLQWGTRSENQRDRVRHGTASRGEQHGMAKMSEADALDAFTSNETAAVCAARLGVGKSTVDHIRRGRLWASVTAGSVRGKPNRPGTPKLTEDDVREIRASAESGRAVARRLGVDPSIVSQIRSGKRWKSVA